MDNFFSLVTVDMSPEDLRMAGAYCGVISAMWLIKEIMRLNATLLGV